jgi:hypothetical protein
MVAFVALASIQGLALIARICFSLLGQQYGLLIADAAALLLTALGLGGLGCLHSCLLASHGVFAPLWAAVNGLLLAGYLGAFEMSPALELGREPTANGTFWEREEALGIPSSAVEAFQAALQVVLSVRGPHAPTPMRSTPLPRAHSRRIPHPSLCPHPSAHTPLPACCRWLQVVIGVLCWRIHRYLFAPPDECMPLRFPASCPGSSAALTASPPAGLLDGSRRRGWL